jgi:tRNA-Thr(GGU) m(6)t(6)A37 methyltransferase TsaA
LVQAAPKSLRHRMNTLFEPIGTVRSCYRERFGIPRQPGLVAQAQASLELLPPWNRAEAVRGLERFSHLWILFLFHANGDYRPRATVRPPRLGGKRRLGVFASRSPFRPNPIGLSVVRLLSIESGPDGVRLWLGGVDLLDGTPVLDIKPYLPYTDRVDDAQGGFADAAPQEVLSVAFAPAAQQALESLGERAGQMRTLIARTLALDPRPAYLHDNPARRDFGMRLEELEIRWRVNRDHVTVVDIVPAAP